MSEYIDEELAEREQTEWMADASDAGKRVDLFVAEKTELTRSAAARLTESSCVEVNGTAVSKNYKLRAGDCCSVFLPETVPDEAQPEEIALNIVYEDQDMIVVNKPKGMVVHPAPGNPCGTLVNALLHHCRDSLSGIGGVIRPGIVHRIDKDTEGLLVVAKNDAAHLSLAQQIKVHDVRRVYYAIALGNFKEDGGTVDAPIGRHPTDRKKMAVIRNAEKKSRPAVTHWQVLRRFGQFTLLRCELETGRTHQIRVHLSSVGHPLLGDSVYGGGGTMFEAKHRSLIQGQCLAACELTLRHPKTGESMHFQVPMPENFEKICEILQKESE